MEKTPETIVEGKLRRVRKALQDQTKDLEAHDYLRFCRALQEDIELNIAAVTSDIESDPDLSEEDDSFLTADTSESGELEIEVTLEDEGEEA